MKHTFSCGIVGESHDCAGDEFLRGMTYVRRPQSITEFGRLEGGMLVIHQFDITPDFPPLMRIFTRRAIENGYEVITCEDHATCSYRVWLQKAALETLFKREGGET